MYICIHTHALGFMHACTLLTGSNFEYDNRTLSEIFKAPICMFVCIYVCNNNNDSVCMYICMKLYMLACEHADVFVCMYVNLCVYHIPWMCVDSNACMCTNTKTYTCRKI